MASISFAPSLQRHVGVESCEAAGATVRDALEAVFAQNARLRSYLLDDTGAVRKHVVIFLDGESIRDREALSDPVSADGEIFVMQALSGG